MMVQPGKFALTSEENAGILGLVGPRTGEGVHGQFERCRHWREGDRA
ncbi:MAG: hypothetical protein R3E79_57305 [Caldilineaceae bacterium]